MVSFSEHEDTRDRESNSLLGYIAIALMPAFGVCAYFGLDFALQWIAGVFA